MPRPLANLICAVTAMGNPKRRLIEIAGEGAASENKESAQSSPRPRVTVVCLEENYRVRHAALRSSFKVAEAGAQPLGLSADLAQYATKPAPISSNPNARPLIPRICSPSP